MAPVQDRWLERLSPRAFRLFLLMLFTLAVLLASQGIRRLAAMRVTYYLTLDRGSAISPLAYGARLPALNAAIDKHVNVRAVVRADSAGDAPEPLCALASALKNDPHLVWIATTQAVDPCIRSQLGTRIVSPSPAARTELARARWLLLDRDGYVLHSARAVPSEADVRELAALLSPPVAAPVQ